MLGHAQSRKLWLLWALKMTQDDLVLHLTSQLVNIAEVLISQSAFVFTALPQEFLFTTAALVIGIQPQGSGYQGLTLCKQLD